MYALETTHYWVIPEEGHLTLPNGKVRIMVMLYATQQDALNGTNPITPKYHECDKVGTGIDPQDYQAEIKEIIGTGEIITI